MELIISRPDNLIVEQMIEQKHIPCFCTVKNDFNIHFQHPLPEAVGKVNNWDRSMLEERVPVGVGGEYSYFNYGQITIFKIEENKYQIVDLALFDAFAGWCPVLIDSHYGPLGKFWGPEEEEFFS